MAGRPESRNDSPRRFTRARSRSNDLQNTLRMLIIWIHPRLHRIDDRLVHHQLPVVADRDLESIHRARRRSFEVEPADIVARPVAWALELLFGLEPSRSASEMRALGEDRVEAGLGADNPGAEILLVLLADFTDYVVVRQAGLELPWRQEQPARKRRAHRREQSDLREGADAAQSDYT